MTKILLLLLAFGTASAFAQETPAPTSTAEVEDSKVFNHRKGHWVVTFGFEGLGYDVPFEFQGERKKFKPDTQELYGGRLGFGRQFYLGLGIVTTTKIEGYYVGTLFEKAVNAAPEEETETFSFTKKSGHIHGGEVSQALGFLFDLKTKNPFMDEMTHVVVEPFIEAGIGRARAYNRVSYHFDTGAAAGNSQVQEDYQHRVVDDLTSARLTAGLNITSNQGFFLSLRVSQQRFDVTEREEHGFRTPDDAGPTAFDTESDDVDMDPVMVYSLGGGYKF